MATEFMEAASFEGTVRGAKQMDEAEKFGYGGMIPVICEAKRWVLEVCPPWLPPRGLWQGLLVFEMDTVSVDILS